MRRAILLVVTSLASFAPLRAQENDPLGGRPLTYWIQQTKSRERFQALEALTVLRAAGPQARAATRAVRRMLKRKDGAVAVAAIETLRSFGKLPKSVVPSLVECLKKKATCAAAMAAIASMGREGRGAERMLVRLIHAPAYRGGALATLEAIEVDIVKLLGKDLEGKRWRSDALQRVRALGDRAAGLVPQLVRVLGFYPRFVTDVGGVKTKAAQQALERAKAAFRIKSKAAAGDRALAAQILGGLGTPDRALPALKKGVFDFDPEAAMSAAWALMVHGAKAAVPTLAKAIDRKRPHNVAFLMAGLRRFGPGSEGAVLTLKKLARRRGKVAQLAGQTVVAIERSITDLKGSASEDRKIRKAATLRLLEYGPAGLPGVLAALRQGDAGLQGAVVQRLASNPGRYFEVGGGAQEAYPELLPPRMDPVPFVQMFVARLRGQDKRLARLSCEALAVIGAPRAESAVPVLQEILADPAAGVDLHVAACYAMVGLGATSEVGGERFTSFVPHLEGAEKPRVEAIVRLFRAAGVRAEAAVPALIGLTDQGGTTAKSVVRVLHAVGPTTIGALVAALRGETEGRRWSAAVVLGMFGSRASVAANALARVAESDASELVRAAAKAALAQVRR